MNASWAALRRVGHPVGAFEVVDRRPLGVEVRPLVDARQERRAPVRRVALGQSPALRVAHHDEARQVLGSRSPGRRSPTSRRTGYPMRGNPVLIMNSAGEWLFDSVKTEWMNAILSTCRPRCGKISETILPHSPRGVNRNGDFISAADLVLEEAGGVLERRVELAHRLAVPALERRLVVPGVDLARPAVDEDPDDPLGPARRSARAARPSGSSDPVRRPRRLAVRAGPPTGAGRPARSARTRRRRAGAIGVARGVPASHRRRANHGGSSGVGFREYR